MITDEIKPRFKYLVEHIRDGKVLHSQVSYNLVPVEGLVDILSVCFKSGTPKANWFIGLFEGNYTPVAGVTAATIAANATECTAYDEATREAWVSGSIANEAVSNVASPAEFTMNATKTVYGGFLISNSTKGGTLGVLMSVVRFSTARPVVNGDVLRITSGLTVVSV